MPAQQLIEQRAADKTVGTRGESSRDLQQLNAIADFHVGNKPSFCGAKRPGVWKSVLVFLFAMRLCDCPMLYKSSGFSALRQCTAVSGDAPTEELRKRKAVDR